MRNIATLTMGFVSFCLAGCGGSSTSGQPRLIDRQFSDYSTRFEDLSESENNLSPYAVTEDTIIGSATYSGVAIYTDVQAVEGRTSSSLAGDLDLTVNFSSTSNIVRGTITNLVDSSDGQLQGDIAITVGQIDPSNDTASGYTLSASLSGDIQDTDGQDLTVRGGLDADFFGSEPDLISGISFLTLEDDDEIRSMRGMIIAETEE